MRHQDLRHAVSAPPGGEGGPPVSLEFRWAPFAENLTALVSGGGEGAKTGAADVPPSPLRRGDVALLGVALWDALHLVRSCCAVV